MPALTVSVVIILVYVCRFLICTVVYLNKSVHTTAAPATFGSPKLLRLCGQPILFFLRQISITRKEKNADVPSLSHKNGRSYKNKDRLILTPVSAQKNMSYLQIQIHLPCQRPITFSIDWVRVAKSHSSLPLTTTVYHACSCFAEYAS